MVNDDNNPKNIDKKSLDFLIYKGTSIIPGIIRLRDAPFYLGMNKTFFRDTVQKYLTRIPIDKKGIGFSRMELDQWIAYTKVTIGQPPKIIPPWENAKDLSITEKPKFFKLKKLLKPMRKRKIITGKPTAADLDVLVKKTTCPNIDLK